MDKKDIDALCALFNELSEVHNEAELERSVENNIGIFGDHDITKLKIALYLLGERMLTVDAENRDALRARRIACLTDAEKAEMQKVEEIIDKNLLKYYFQPIISASTGDIYSYEALMRSAADPSITPFHILKYAGLNDRLDDIERATFFNILKIIESDKEKFGGKTVFINSIPNVCLGEADVEMISAILSKYSDMVVVELIESAEADEAQLIRLKDTFSSMDIKIAVDDYGTGYSNVSNLLRYKPDFVKIDRSLISEINCDSNKKHFVRDIIEFCHDNDILALAEGVETDMEMKTLIIMGIDLIQGYYTARPAPEPISAIPYEIRQEIRRFQQQRQDGEETHVYKVEGTERILLEKMKKHGYKCIRILATEDDGDISIVGNSSLETQVHIEIDSGFKGRVTLESANLSNTKNRPCIQLAEDCVVELSVLGDCKLQNGGIIVPESSELTFTGLGSLTIKVHNPSFYGIGAHLDERHGRISFSADVTFVIEAFGQFGTCIGSGLGGEIDIHRGIFNISMNCNNGVAIGSMTGNTDLDIRYCGIEVNSYSLKGAIVGSRDGTAELILHSMSLRCNVSGKETVCVGSLQGPTNLTIENSNFASDVRSDKMTVFGSLYNKSIVTVHNISMNIDAGGQEAYVIGGLNGNTVFDCTEADMKIVLNSGFNSITSAQGDDLVVGDGRYQIRVNGQNFRLIPEK